MKPYVNNEYGKLKSVVIASAEGFDPQSLEITNLAIQHYSKSGELLSKEKMLIQQRQFRDALKRFGVNIFIAEQVEGDKGQMFTRDLGFVIGDLFFISSMVKESRGAAINGWKKILQTFPKQKIIEVPHDVFLEGGDVLIDGKDVYVGLSERTNEKGVQFLKEKLGRTYKIIPIKLKANMLHLDVVFTIIGPNLAIVYKDGIYKRDYHKLSNFHKIEITTDEQADLGANVLMLDSNTVLVQMQHNRIKEKLCKLNKQVISVDFSEIAKCGGAFRCTTCPIERDR